MKAALSQIADIAEKNGIMVIDKAAAEKIAELRKKINNTFSNEIILQYNK